MNPRPLPPQGSALPTAPHPVIHDVPQSTLYIISHIFRFVKGFLKKISDFFVNQRKIRYTAKKRTAFSAVRQCYFDFFSILFTTAYTTIKHIPISSTAMCTDINAFVSPYIAPVNDLKTCGCFIINASKYFEDKR